MKQPYEFSEAHFPEYEIISVRAKDSLKGMGKYIGTLFSMMRQRQLEPAGPIFAVYHEQPTNPEAVDYEMCLPVAGNGNALDDLVDFGGDRCLKTTHKGAYDGLGAAYAALEDEMTRRGLTIGGPPREVYVRGPLLGFLSFIPTMVTDIYFPIKPA